MKKEQKVQAAEAVMKKLDELSVAAEDKTKVLSTAYHMASVANKKKAKK